MTDEKTQTVGIIICGASDFHPYECDHDERCIHCSETKTDTHDPEKCALCRWDET